MKTAGNPWTWPRPAESPSLHAAAAHRDATTGLGETDYMKKPHHVKPMLPKRPEECSRPSTICFHAPTWLPHQIVLPSFPSLPFREHGSRPCPRNASTAASNRDLTSSSGRSASWPKATSKMPYGTRKSAIARHLHRNVACCSNKLTARGSSSCKRPGCTTKRNTPLAN